MTALAAFAVLQPPLPAAAQVYDTGASAVARVSVVRGAVSLRHGDDGAAAAPVNASVFAGDYVTTGRDGRAEIQFDAASAVRLGSGVQLRFTRLDETTRTLQLAAGTIELRVLRNAASDTEVETPSITVRPDAAGSYRIAVDGDGRTQLTVRSGRADAIGAQETRIVVPGATLIAQGPASAPVMRTAADVAFDDFDRFNDERDAGEMRALADANAPPGVAGIGDLSTYGRWVSDATYGTVWTPYVTAPGWAPYTNGAWSWAAPYGWTWIGYEPWGWAPYHYGRWYRHPHYGWCWVPARAFVPWQPALVGFVTIGPGTGFGRIGWVPLAPFETGRVTVRRLLNARYGVTTASFGEFRDGRFHRRATWPERRIGTLQTADLAALAPARRNMTAANALAAEPWQRFGALRRPGVRVIEGTTARTAGVRNTAESAWSRFDRDANPRPEVMPQRISAGGMPSNGEHVHYRWAAPAYQSNVVAPPAHVERLTAPHERASPHHEHAPPAHRRP